MARRRCGRAWQSRKLPENRTDGFGAVDIVVLGSEKRGCDPRKGRIGEGAGHAVAAAIDAVEHDVARSRAIRLDVRLRALVVRIAIPEVGDSCIFGLAAVDAAP